MFIGLMLSACAAPIYNLTKTQYVHQAFSAEQLQNGGLCLLPITAGEGQEGYRRPLGNFMNQYLTQSVDSAKNLTWQETMLKLNDNNKVSIYESIIMSYQKTSILNKEKLKQLKTTLEVDFALYCSLQDFSEKTETSYNFFSGYSTNKTANVQAHCLVINLNTGDVMQEIIGRAKSVGNEMSYNREYDQYADILARAVLSQLPGSKVQPPDEKTL